MKSHILWTLPKIPILKFCFKLNFNNINSEKMKNFKVDYYNILTIGIDNIESYVNIISELVFSIILHIFQLHILLEGKY